MGISGLLPFVKKASRPSFLREFKGKVAAVDTYCWLHRGAFSCAEKLAKGEPTDMYVLYVMKMVNLLLSHHIKPIMVFDGCNLPSKAVTEKKRRDARKKNRALAKELLREGRVKEARECFQRCVDITSEMARAVIQACRNIDVDVIVAPYEADAQLAYLSEAGFADLVITEDSDLILFGCNQVLFKLDTSGGALLVEKDKLHLAMGLPEHKFSFPMFRNMCVLSGCDYLPSLPGIGLAKACKFFTLTSNPDTYSALTKLPAYLKMSSLEVTVEYRENFQRAVATFLHQLVVCPRDRKLRPLTEPQGGYIADEHPYAGEFIGHEQALQIALGNIDIQSKEKVDNFDPDTNTRTVALGSSTIWHKDYSSQSWQQPKKKTPLQAKHEAPRIFASSPRSPCKPKQMCQEVDINKLLAKRRREAGTDEENDILALYKQNKSRRVDEAHPISDASIKKHEESSEVYSPHNPFAKESLNLKPSSDAPTTESPKKSHLIESPKLKRRISSNVAVNPFAKTSSSPYCRLMNLMTKDTDKKRPNVIVKSRYFRSTSDISVSKTEANKLLDEATSDCSSADLVAASQPLTEANGCTEDLKAEANDDDNCLGTTDIIIQPDCKKGSEQIVESPKKENPVSSNCNSLDSVTKSPENEAIKEVSSPGCDLHVGLKSRFSFSRALSNSIDTSMSSTPNTSTSPYFSQFNVSSNKSLSKSSCRTPGLPRKKSVTKQLNIKEMFSFKR